MKFRLLSPRGIRLVPLNGPALLLDVIVLKPALAPGFHMSPSLVDWHPWCMSPYSPAALCVLQSGEQSQSLTETFCLAGSLRVPRMSASPVSMSQKYQYRNMTTNECFQSRSTVLQGQPFGGIPTVLVLNIILWVVSHGCHGETLGGLSQDLLCSSDKGHSGDLSSKHTSHSNGTT